MKKTSSLLLLCVIAFTAHAQNNVGIGTADPNNSAALDITSTSKGLLIPRMNTSAVNNIPNPAKGLMVLDTTKNQLVFNIGTPALPNWQSNAFGGWSTTGNAGTDPATNFIGTTDFKDLVIRTRNVQSGLINYTALNTSWGYGALNPTTTGLGNTASGFAALNANTSGQFNTASGLDALVYNTSGSNNTANGRAALTDNVDGVNNSAFGASALFHSVSGNDNTATGVRSLLSMSSGNLNSAYGSNALSGKTTGENNTALGANAGKGNITGNNNVFLGFSAGQHETGSNRLYISSSDADANNALIYGEFDNHLLKINGQLTINVAPKAVGLDIGSAAIKVSGTSPAVFTVTANAAVLDLVIPNTSMANSSTDILIVTHKLTGIKLNTSPGVYWNGTNWVIFLENFANHIVGEQFNVMVIKQ